MMTYSWKQTLLSIAIIGLIIFLVNKFTGSSDEIICDRYNSFKQLEIDGVVKEKLIDKNDHNNRIIIYGVDGGVADRLNLSFDGSKLFNDIKAGDSLFKQINSAEVLVNGKIKYRIDYGVKCD